LLGLMLMRNALATSIRTFMKPWLLQTLENKGRLFFKFNQVRNESGFGARTGRMSSSPNLMNIPSKWEMLYGTLAKIGYKRKFDLPDLREYILPDPGCKLVALDYSQQEMRLFAHFEDGELMRAYQKDPTIDAHEMVAKISGLTRKIAKTLNFAALYGAGLGVVMLWLDCTQQEAAAFRSQYRTALPGVKELSDSIEAQVRTGKPITTIGGRDYRPEPPKYINGVLRSFVYKLLNYLMQGSAADQTKQAMIDYFYHKAKSIGARIMFVVHDELVMSIPIKHLAKDTALMHQCMVNSFAADLDVKFLVDVETGENYANT
jgi:DNA polymerase-1